jgi:hypothetical protein
MRLVFVLPTGPSIGVSVATCSCFLFFRIFVAVSTARS